MQVNNRVAPDRKAASRLIISTDGEGENLPFRDPDYVHPDTAVAANGWHTYTLLAASDDTGEHGRRMNITNPRANREETNELARNYGLTTEACLKMLTSLPQNAIVVSFYFSYDVTKIVADLPILNLRELATGRILPVKDCEDCKERNQICHAHYHAKIRDVARQFGLSTDVVKGSGIVSAESTIWGNYCIQYMPRKKLTIIDLSAGRSWSAKDKRPEWNRKVIVWDVFGFFQKPFVGALQDAKNRDGSPICPPEIVDRIAAMKDQRGAFAKLDDSAILAYCYEECYYLSKLVRDMLMNLERFGLTLNAFDGTGAIARAWMTREKIADYKTDTNLSMEIALMAYFGGRFEVSEIGYMGRLYSYDINSAYPFIVSTLPCLAHGHFRQLEKDVNGLVTYEPGKFGVYFAGSNTSGRYAPFPFRIDDKRAMAQPELIHPKSVYYAHGGKRWVWSNGNPAMSEVGIAIKHFGSDAIPLYDGWVWEPECDHVPFRMVPDMYRERKILKKNGDGMEKVIKLLLNSIYGKTAQSVGITINKDGSYKLPKFQSFIWAGMITSGCRAMILDAIMQSDTVSIATDGILSRTPIDSLPLSGDLGDWEDDIVEDAYLFQSGVYTMLKTCKSDCKHPDKVYMNEDGTIVHEPFKHEITSDGQNATRVFKTRGFSRKEIPAQKLIDAWNSGNRDALTLDPEPEATRFVPFKAGVLRTDAFKYIGQWVQSTHKVTIAHNRRNPEYTLDEYGLPTESFGQTLPSTAPVFDSNDESAAYTMKETWEEIEDEREYQEGDFYEALPAELA